MHFGASAVKGNKRFPCPALNMTAFICSISFRLHRAVRHHLSILMQQYQNANLVIIERQAHHIVKKADGVFEDVLEILDLVWRQA